MTVLSDRQIRDLCLRAENPMIHPYVDGQVRRTRDNVPVISYGTSSYGYDVRLARTMKLFSNVNNALVDPCNMDEENSFIDLKSHTDALGREYVIMPPNSYALGHTVERFNIPDNVTVICVGKSTYARAGIIVNVTPIEAGFEGEVVIELSNSAHTPVKVYLNQGISQFIFMQAAERCETSYADRGGKYQGQTGITVSKV